MDIKNMIKNRNVLSNEAVHYIRGYLIYLRKSRQDSADETVEEVLAKHEKQLQEFAMHELGGLVPEENIYREVVSGGESLDEREEIKKVLSRIESGDIEGVIVVDPQRLSRGSLTDCDRLIMSFQFTSTLVVTPMLTYDMKKKMERRFFQDELMRGRDYLDYVKETLWRGRVGAAKRGCFSSPTAPFGFDRVKIGKDWTLEPNDGADTVRLIFELYTKDGETVGEITRRLNTLGIPSRTGKPWDKSTVGQILRNPTYNGKIRFNYRKHISMMENGERVTKQLTQYGEDVIIVEGKHAAIIDDETFEAAQTRRQNNPRAKIDLDLQNVLAGILRCKECGRVMIRTKKSKTSRYDRFECSNQCCRSTKAHIVIDALAYTLERVKLPELRTKLENGEGNAAVIQKRRIDKLVKQLAEYRDQEDFQYDQLETGKYTQEVFDRRNKALREKIDACEKEIYQARQAMPKNINYEERIATLQETIEALKDPDMSVEMKNKLLRSVLDRVEYSKPKVSRKMNEGCELEVFLKL